MNRTRSDNRGARHQYLVAIDGALALTVVMLVVQMWLLTASLEAHLAGDKSSAWPGVIFSALLFTGNFGLYLFVRNLERQARNKKL